MPEYVSYYILIAIRKTKNSSQDIYNTANIKQEAFSSYSSTPAQCTV